MMVFFEGCTLTFEVGKDTKGYKKKKRLSNCPSVISE